MRHWVLIVTGLLVFLVLPAAADVTGKARVISGDILEIAGERIRLHGIDAPELKQTCLSKKGKESLCGELSKQALQILVRGQDVRCKEKTRGPGNLLIAVCYVGPFDINEQMVADGRALAFPQNNKDYARAETFARARREGIWRMKFEPPWEWRKRMQ